MNSSAPADHLGARLRTSRRMQGHTLKTLAQKTGFTEAYLSQVETGRASPTLASLKRIASAYGLSMVELLTDDPPADNSIVLRRADRRRLLQGKGGVAKELLVRRQSGKRLEPLYVTIAPLGGSNGQYDHAGEEFGLVLSGRVELTVEERVYRVKKGDAFYFSSTRLHGFRNPSPRHKAVVLWVITPPSF
jgi:transcriptional regulator with XRE-family HTH domain